MSSSGRLWAQILIMISPNYTGKDKAPQDRRLLVMENCGIRVF